MSALHTAGPWYWHTDHRGNVSLRTPDRGNLIVMDFARKGMQSAGPRFAVWPGIYTGTPRERLGGIIESLLVDKHPDALLIAAAPELLSEIKQTYDLLERCVKEQHHFASMMLGLVNVQQTNIRDVIAKAEGRK